MKALKITITALLLVLVLSGLAAFASDKAIGNPLVIDVRTEDEWNTGHLEGAILIPYDRITDGISKLSVDKKEQIYLYCRSGRRSGLALDVLKKSGYENVVNLGNLDNASKVLNIPVVK